MRDRLWRESCGTTTTDGRSPRDSGWTIISPSTQRRAGSRAAGKEYRSALLLSRKAAIRELCRWRMRSGAFRSGPGTHRKRPKWIPADGREESRLGTQRPGQASQLTWRGIGSERTEDAPEELLQSEPADLARHWLGETEDAPKELLRTVQEPGEEAGRPRVEAGHSEAWASEPADLARHWLGETEDASEELLRTVQEPGEKAGRPRPHGASIEAPGELAFQHGEHEGSLGRVGDDGSRRQHQAGLCGDEDRDAEVVEAPDWSEVCINGQRSV
jgi:hypothetical protein